MGLLANRAATRMQTRQMYRTASRMRRRRGAMGLDGGGGDEPPEPAPQQPQQPQQPAYLGELEQLSKLREQGVITPEEFDAKKRQLLGV